MIFLISSSGFVIYKTSCSCTDTEQVSIFVQPNTCGKTFHQHHKHDRVENEIACTAHECHECESHIKSCGCDSPQIFFFKLNDKAVDGEVNFVNVQILEIFMPSADIFQRLLAHNSGSINHLVYADPPPKSTRSLDFLIQIQQLKIPSLA